MSLLTLRYGFWRGWGRRVLVVRSRVRLYDYARIAASTVETAALDAALLDRSASAGVVETGGAHRTRVQNQQHSRVTIHEEG